MTGYMIMKKIALGLSAVLLASFAFTVQAAEFIAPADDDSSGAITVPREETHRNLYIAGGSVTVSSNTTGDLYAAGGTITIEGDVEEDLVVGGGNITVNGRVGGDVRIGGGNVVINNEVGGDVLIGGGNVRLSDQASVGGDLVAGAGTLELHAPVAGDARIGGGVITIASRISGGVWIRSNESLTFARGAEVGNVSYKGARAAVVQDGANVGDIDFKELSRGHRAKQGLAGIATLGFVLQLLTFILAGLVLLWIFPKRISALAHGIIARPGMNLLIGLLTVIVTPILAFILLLTGIGWVLSLIILALYFLILIKAAVMTTIFVGSWVVQKLTKKPEMRVDWQAVVIGVIIVAIVALIPVVGWIAVFVAWLMSVGGILRMINTERM